MKRKVLLIGLGGTGCAVVSKVKRMVEENDRNTNTQRQDRETYVEFLGFDTDINQEKAPGLQIIRTSRDAKAIDMLNGESGWSDWFPNESQLFNRGMEQGAGQKRVLSRLAFSDTVRRGALTDLANALDRLNMNNGMVNRGLKVMIVSSFAGGTGSGMFLQFPLFLRAYIKERFENTNVMIRGLFGLPDLFKSVSKGKIQLESMYSNAYASLRELSAMNAICNAKNPDVFNYDMTINGLFDSQKMLKQQKREAKRLGRDDVPSVIPAAKRPYDMIFFVDNLNGNSNVLAETKDYIEQMAEITYIQVYSPMGPSTDSAEDNLIEEMMETDGEAMYSSAGSARLLYPQEDIAKYCALRSCAALLSKRWTVIDKHYESLLAAAEERQKSDYTVTLPTREDVFVSDINKYLDDKNGEFAFLRSDLFVTRKETSAVNGKDETTTVTKKRLDEYLSFVGDYIQASYEEDGEIKKRADACKYAAPRNNDVGNLKVAIQNMEGALVKYEEAINTRTDLLYSSVADAILPQDLGGILDEKDKPYNIHALLEKEGKDGAPHAVHPIAARYLLYELKKHFDKEYTRNNDDRTTAYNAIVKYQKEDRNLNTEDIIEDWAAGIPNGGFARKKYRRDYEAECIKQKNTLGQYCACRLTSAVYKVLLERVKALIAAFERTFDSLDAVATTMNDQAAHVKQKYANQGKDTLYLCVDSEYLDKIEEKLSRSSAASKKGNDTSDMYDSLFAAVYQNGMRQLELQKEFKNNRKTQLLLNNLMSSKTLSLFNSKILPQYQDDLVQKYPDLLDMDLFQAINQEVEIRLLRQASKAGELRTADELTVAEKDEARRELLGEVYMKAAPYLLCKDHHRPNPLIAGSTGDAISHEALTWGINDDVCKEIEANALEPEKYLENSFSNEKNIVPSRMYSSRELACYRAIYSISLTEIPKFAESTIESEQGIFYKNYANRVRKMLLGRYDDIDAGITPHLDIRWHSRQYLPPIDPARAEEDDKNAARAMWLGYLYHLIRKNLNTKTSMHDAYVYFLEPGRKGETSNEVFKPYQLRYNGEPVRVDQIYDVFKAFQQNTLITDELLKLLNPRLEKDAGRIQSEDFVGRRANELVKALYCKEDQEESLEEMANAGIIDQFEDDADDDQYDGIKNTNVLVMMGRLIRKKVNDKETKLIRDALVEILEELTEKLSDDRKQELLMLIFVCSPFTTVSTRRPFNVALIPYFEKTMAEYDRRYNTSRKKAAKSAAADTAEAAESTPAAKKTTTRKKTAAPKKNP